MIYVRKLLPFELTNGNDGRGRQWYRPARVRRAFERDLKALGLVRKPFDAPVAVTITRILGKGQRKWDADSVLRGNAKELLDALVAVGWFHDDGPEYIHAVTGLQDDTRRSEGPAIEIEVSTP